MKETAPLWKIGLVLCLFGSTIAFGQPDTVWTRTYGGAGWDYGWCVQQTSDNGYIITGMTDPLISDYDIYLIKTDEDGDTLWTRTYDKSTWDEGWVVRQTADNGYVITGQTGLYGTMNRDLYIIKTDEYGDTLWTRTYGGTGWDEGRAMQQTSDGGYIIAGQSDSYGDFDVYVIKTDENGDSLWTRIYGGAGWDEGRGVCQTPDSGFVIAGWTSSFGPAAVWLLKTDANGDTLWTRTYSGEEWSDGRSVQLTTDGGYIIAGTYASYASGADVFLIKTDVNGDTLWTGIYGGSWDEYGNYVQQTNDGGFIVAGYAMSPGPTGFDVYIVRTDASGNEVWSLTYGGQESDFGYWVEQTLDNGYIVAGQTGSFGAGNDDAWLLKIAPEPGIEENAGGVIQSALSEVFPNPFRVETQIRCQLLRPGVVTVAIYDVSGQRIKTLVNERRDPGYFTVTWDGQDQDDRRVNSGVYFCRVAIGEYTQAEKLLLMR